MQTIKRPEIEALGRIFLRACMMISDRPMMCC